MGGRASSDSIGVRRWAVGSNALRGANSGAHRWGNPGAPCGDCPRHEGAGSHRGVPLHSSTVALPTMGIHDLSRMLAASRQSALARAGRFRQNMIRPRVLCPTNNERYERYIYMHDDSLQRVLGLRPSSRRVAYCRASVCPSVELSRCARATDNMKTNEFDREERHASREPTRKT